MKKIILQAIAFLLPLSCLAEMRQALTLRTNDGDIVYYLDQQPQIAFSGQDMLVTANDDTKTIPMENVVEWVIGMAESGTIDIATAKPMIRVSSDGVNVLNPNRDNITVYDIKGRVVGTSTSAVADFSLSNGIYIITIGTQTFKIAKN